MTVVTDSLILGNCPDCRANAWKLGPRGGLARNVECVNCRARFNVSPISFERIPKESEGGPAWLGDYGDKF